MFHPTDHVADHADAFLHDLLDAEDAAYVTRHCADCEPCRAALEQARARLASLASLPPHEPAEPLIRGTLRGVEEHEQRRRRLRKRVLLGLGVLTAASALVLTGFHVYYANLAPTPADLRVYGQTHLLASSPASLRVRLMNHHTGQPLAGVPVTVKLHDWNNEYEAELASFTTDAHGSGAPAFELPDWPAGDYELFVSAATPKEPEVVRHPVRLGRPARVLLSSDKPVYQPGQTIRVRALGLRRPRLRPLADQQATFTIRDPKDNIIFKKTLTTSKYGIAAVDCPLASEVNEGNYTVACVIEPKVARRSAADSAAAERRATAADSAAAERRATLTVGVRKYVLPKFKLELKADKPYYLPGDRVKVTLEARYVFGEPAAGAKVEVVTEPKKLYMAELKTDASGKVAFEFTLPQALDGADMPFEVRVNLTDTAGQKQSAALSSLVAASPLRVAVIPESGTLVRGIANRVYVYVSRPDGSPAKASLIVAPPWRQVETNEVGVAVVEVTPKAESLRFSVRARDGAGQAGERQVELVCGEPGADFLLRTDKAVYDGGDTLRLEVLGGSEPPGSSRRSSTVFLDVLCEGQTVRTAAIDVKDGRGTYQLDLPAEWFGAMQLCAYRIGTDGQSLRKSRVFYVRPADQVRVQAQLDRKEYRPGGAARLTLTLTGKDGQPAPGAVSLSAVDEAVFQLGTAASPEQQFFLLGQPLLWPVYQLYRWTPDLKATIPDAKTRGLLEQALFSAPVRRTR